MFEDEDYNSDELIVSTKTEYDAEENALRPKTMADYVGQEKVKENLGVYIAAAKQRGEALDHVLLYGPPGLGKTTLALAFARALGEYGATSMIAGYTPGKTATIATTVYQLWRTNDEAGAMRWVLVDIVISAVVLLAVNLLEKKQKAGGRA